MKNKLTRVMVGSLTAGIAGGQVMTAAPAAVAQPASSAHDAEVTSAQQPPIAGTEAAIASPTRAAADPPACPGQVCVYQDRDWKGHVYDFTAPNQDSDYTNGTPDWNGTNNTINDQVSSYVNHSGQWVKFYQDDHFSADTFCAGPGASSSDLRNFFPNTDDYNPNDSFSSHQTFASRPSGCTLVDTN